MRNTSLASCIDILENPYNMKTQIFLTPTAISSRHSFNPQDKEFKDQLKQIKSWLKTQ